LPDKFFNFIFSLPLIRKFKPLYEKKKELIYYLFFGVLTTVVGIGTFSFFVYAFQLNEHIANTLSWIAAVTFAFFTNRIWVFSAPTDSKSAFFRQLLSFYGGRLFSFGVEEIIIFIFITRLEYNELLIKILGNIVVLILNYIVSKLFVFKKKTSIKNDIPEVEDDRASDQNIH